MMQLFRAEIHTPDTLASQIEDTYRLNPETIMIGSLGRAAIYDEYIGDPDFEFTSRNQTPLVAGQFVRDMDVFSAGSARPAAEGPFPVDTTTYNNPLVEIVREGDDWWLTSAKRDFAEEIDPDTMEPRKVNTIYGIECVVLPAQTQLEIIGLNGAMREKDVKNAQLLKELLDGQAPEMPDELFKPFRKLRDTKSEGMYGKVQSVYHILPERLRSKVQPLTRALKYKLPF
jgi:hypothetical protein